MMVSLDEALIAAAVDIFVAAHGVGSIPEEREHGREIARELSEARGEGG
jgi:hypothetical protein